MPYIDRDIAIEVLKSNVEELEADPYYGPHPGVPEQYIEDILVDEVPVADVVEVVRCENCEYSEEAKEVSWLDVYCFNYDLCYCTHDKKIVGNKHYCGYGERKEVE